MRSMKLELKGVTSPIAEDKEMDDDDVTTHQPSPYDDDRSLRFVPADMSLIPKPTVLELKQVFRDVDSYKVGYITTSQLLAAFAVNQIALTQQEIKALLYYLANKPERRTDDGIIPAGVLTEEDFVRCAFALSFKNREVGLASIYAVFPDSDFTTETVSTWFKWKRWAWKLLEMPMSSRAAFATAWILSGIILLSVSSFIAESYQDVKDAHPDLFQGIEIFCIVVFTMEYIVRMVSTPEPKKLFFSVFHWVDLLSIAPFYLEAAFDDIAGNSAPLLRSLRLIRIFRLIKIGRYVAWMRIFGRTIETSGPPLGMLAFVAATMIIFWGTMGYFLERGDWDDSHAEWVNGDGQPSPFTSIPSSFWWTVVSMATVGFGDMFPITFWGRCIAVVAILIGVMLLAIPISVVTGNLHAEYDRMDKLRRLRAEHEAQLAAQPLAAAPDAPKPDAIHAVRASSTLTAGSDSSGHHPEERPRLRPLRSYTDLQLGRSHASVDELNVHLDPEGDHPVEEEDAHAVIRAPHTASSLSVSHISSLMAPQQRSSDTVRMDASWSEPFLRSTLQVIRGNRRRVMSSLKALELKNREHAVEDLQDFVGDMSDPDRGRVVLRTAMESGLVT